MSPTIPVSLVYKHDPVFYSLDSSVYENNTAKRTLAFRYEMLSDHILLIITFRMLC